MLNEINIFLTFLYMGLALGAVFFIGGRLTSKIKKPKAQIIIESILLAFLFIAIFIAFFLAVLFINFGAFRVYMLVAVVVGFYVSYKVCKFVALFIQKIYNKNINAKSRYKKSGDS